MQQEFHLPSLKDTIELAQLLALNLSVGDTVLLSGVVGAGKTYFVRQVILKMLEDNEFQEDIPSPTFTLVQSYETRDLEIWHADLYRLTSLDEIYELGLEDAFDNAVCFVEWPKLLGNLTPKSALNIQFEIEEDDTRKVFLEWEDVKWNNVIKILKNKMMRD